MVSAPASHAVTRATFPSSFKAPLITIQRNREKVTFGEAQKRRTWREAPGDPNLREAEETPASPSCRCSRAHTCIWIVFVGEPCLEAFSGSGSD